MKWDRREQKPIVGMMISKMDQESGVFRVLLVGVGDNSQEEKDVFCKNLSKNYGISYPLLRKIADRCPIILKKNLSQKKAESLAKTLKSFGATVSVEEKIDSPPIALEFQEITPRWQPWSQRLSRGLEVEHGM